ncbi:hypothetical protein GJV10_16935 [Ewingella americana]|jgi:hypothetical protein|nr:hypothetical protein [Ewingella americana]
MSDNSPRVQTGRIASEFLSKLVNNLREIWSKRPDYYGEMLRQHPEIDPETVMKIV